jgi:3-phosphoshikimate 1-carboxyvinyltransferase
MTLPVVGMGPNETSVQSTVTIANPKSKGYLQMTLDVMKAYGIQFQASDDLTHITIPSGQNYTAQTITPEADWSGGAFLLTAQYLGVFESVLGLKRDSIQPDAQIVEMLERHGLEVHEDDNFSDPTEMTMSGKLKGPLRLDLTQTPDLFPPLVLLALFSEGEHRFSGVHRLRGKESDRAYVMANELAKAGAALSVEGDELVVLGMPNWRDALLNPHGDHRMAMLFGLINSLVPESITTQNPECVAKSFPHFWDQLD